jgi:DNA-binding transcriptional regulator YiaG
LVGAASKAVVYQWESGKRKPSPVFWLRIKRMQRGAAPPTIA